MDLAGLRLRLWGETDKAAGNLVALVYVAYEPVKALDRPPNLHKGDPFQTLPYWNAKHQAWKIKKPEFFEGGSQKPLLEAMKNSGPVCTDLFDNYDEAWSVLNVSMEEFERRWENEQVPKTTWPPRNHQLT